MAVVPFEGAESLSGFKMPPTPTELLHEALANAREEADKIELLLRNGYSVRGVAAFLGIPRSTAGDRVAKVRFDRNIPAKNTGGRKRMLSVQDIRALGRMIVAGTFKTWRQVQAEYTLHASIKMCRTTVRRYCKLVGIKSRAMLRTPPLTKATMAKRLAFAKKYLHWEQAKWDSVLWSDESAFRLFVVDGRARILRPDGCPLRPQDYQIRAHSGGGMIMVWGAMCSRGVGVLVRIEGTLNAHKYVEQILENALPESMSALRLRRDRCIFMQDNAPAHSAIMSKTKLAEMGLKVLEWPPFSPDLNPIEHLWANMKQEIARMPQVANLAALWARIQAIWGNLTAQDTSPLTGNMRERMEAVIEAKGGATRF